MIAKDAKHTGYLTNSTEHKTTSIKETKHKKDFSTAKTFLPYIHYTESRTTGTLRPLTTVMLQQLTFVHHTIIPS